jgi:hypothetical protein
MLRVSIAVVAVAAVAAAGLGLRAYNRSAAASKPQGQVRASMDNLPLAFEANQGQTDPTVKYLARGSGYTVFLTENEAVFELKSSPAAHAQVASRHAIGTTSPEKDESDVRARESGSDDQAAAIRLNLIGANAQPQISASSPLPGHSNYFIGNDRSQWHTNVEHYGRVSYREVYPGVDMTFYGGHKQLEFDFVVAAGASASPIRLGVSGADHIATDDSGNLVLTASAGSVELRKPVAYQEKDGTREPVDVLFVQHATHQVSFVLGNYDHSRALVIDPSVSYATYLGGTAEDDAYGIAIDSNGDAYVTGQTASTDFPTVTGSFSTKKANEFDAFVTKISADGSKLIYSTYVGGNGEDSGNAIAVDGSGDAYVAGGTGSSNFPHNGGYQTSLKGSLDAFVFELNPTGAALTYSTYLGGSSADSASGIALHDGNAYVVGSTQSSDFPTENPIQSGISGVSNGFVTVLNSSGSALVYSTYLGGGSGDFASAVAVDSSGNAYVTGGTENPGFPVTSNAFQKTCGTGSACNGGLFDAFVTVYNATGSAYVYSTFLGGEGIDEGLGIAVDASGDAYVTGLTQSAQHFPLKSPLQSALGGIQDAFVTELNPAGTALVYSTLLGGGLPDAGTSIAVDGNLNAYVTGQTGSSDFPTANPTQNKLGGDNDAFVSEINPTGSQLLFSTYLGGALNENTNQSGANLAAIGSIAVNSTGANIYVAGNTASTDFPTIAPEQSTNGGGTDAFVAMYTQNSTGPDFTISGTALTGVTPGGSSMSTITIAAVNGYAGTVNFTCSVAAVSGGTPLPTCSIPTAVTGGAGTSTLKVNTTGSVQARNRGAGKVIYAMWLPVVGLSLLGMRVGMRGSVIGSRWKKLLGFLLLGAMMTALFFLPACSSSNNSGGGGGGGCSGCTPAGTYTVTVTGTDSTNANLTHSVSPALSLTVTDPLP